MSDVGWFAIRSPADFITDQLVMISEGAAHDSVPEAFRVKSSGPWSAVVMEGGTPVSAHEWCQAMSSALGTAGWSFAVFDGAWSCHVFEVGQHIAGIDAHTAAATTLVGDPAAAAGILEIDADLLQKYCIGNPFADVDTAALDADARAKHEKDMSAYEKKFRAVDGDEYPPWDPRAHAELAEKADIEMPDPGEGTRLAMPQKQRPSMWTEPQPRLSPEDNAAYRFEPAAFREAHPARRWWKFW